MEIEKGRGFVTFSKTEATDKAISDVSNFAIFKEILMTRDFDFRYSSGKLKSIY